MPFDLQQRLSEFSYGYGITREVQACLENVGLRPVPFLPSLLHEAQVGCDVYFERPGTALLLQFKLGQELKRYRRSNLSMPAPVLHRPFWRFGVDTAEEDGQYDLLLKAERGGSEVYYVAPRFSDWDGYATAFQNNEVLNSSLLMKPSEIDKKLQMHGEPDGSHKVVYDRSNVYVCSETQRVEETYVEDIAHRVRAEILESEESIAAKLKRVLESLDQRRAIRRPPVEETSTDATSEIVSDEEKIVRVPWVEIGRSPLQMARVRAERLENLRKTAESEDDAIFAAVGVETWAAGGQLFAVTTS